MASVSRVTCRIVLLLPLALSSCQNNTTDAPEAVHDEPSTNVSPANSEVHVESNLDENTSEPDNQPVSNKAEPVTGTIDATPASVAAGSPTTLTVKVQIASGWHIYAVDKPTGLSAPTTLKLILPDGMETTGSWSLPEATPDFSLPGQPAFIYNGKIELQIPVIVSSDAAPGNRTIQCEFGYQACNAFSCLPPTSATLETSLDVLDTSKKGD